MPQKTISVTRTAVAIGVACAVAGIGAGVAVSTPAFAVDEASAGVVRTATFDRETGSLTIVKKVDPTSYGTPTSTADDATSATGDLLNGVRFEVTKITGDIHTQATFEALSKLTPEQAASQLDTATTQTVTTAGTGRVTLNNLPIGAYYVKEVDASKATKTDGTAVSGIAMSKPFIVFVPTTVGGDTPTWNYDVVAVPKNSSSSITKTVADANKNAGDSVEYTLSTQVPMYDKASTGVKTFSVVDTPDSRFDLSSLKVTSVTVGGVTMSKDNYTVTTGDTTVTTAFTEAARSLLTPGAEVVVHVEATLPAVGTGGMNVTNTVSVNGSFTDNTTFTNDGPEVVTKLGKLSITKKNGDGTKTLSGAQFDLYRCTVDETNHTYTTYGSVIGGTKTTDASGLATWDGIQVTDFENNATVVNTTEKLCLYETKPPSGYEKRVEPVVIDFTTAALGSGVVLSQDVINIPSNASHFPMTGGQGVAALIGGGVLIATLGGVVYVRRSRRVEQTSVSDEQ